MAWFFLKEKIILTTVIGGCFILGGIYLASVYNYQQQKKKAA
jgi:drug/metabolite transporter (DMT)-like permease